LLNFTHNIHSVKLPKSFVAINLSEKVPDAFGRGKGKEKEVESKSESEDNKDVEEAALPPPALDG
jgi:inositol hexakisphosphate/diphosphoinositol-pentakisphosphate kinase